VVDTDSFEGWLWFAGQGAPATYTVKTRNPDPYRLQYYFKMPEGVRVKNSAGAIAPGVDVRGDGGMVLIPPSLHPSGNRYAVEDDLEMPRPLRGYWHWWWMRAPLRGIADISAVTIATELGKVCRFDSARQLMGYCGAVPSEDPSGKRTRRGGITKTGNALATHRCRSRMVLSSPPRYLVRIA
jgi:hypothetical protein